LSIIVACADDSIESISTWAGNLAFRLVREDRRVPLTVEGAEPLDDGRQHPMVRGFASLPVAGRLRLARIQMRALGPLEPAPPSSVALYDLVGPQVTERTRSVAVFGALRERLSLAFASDLHWASFWDVIAEAVERHAPDLALRLLNPRRLLERFIAEANQLWARGELDLIVLGGDLVEYVGAIGANVQNLVQALAGLRVPSIAIAGNHDYRAFAWRPRSYGLRAVGIPAGREKAILQAAGLWSRWPVRPSDLRSLRTTDDAGTPALASYLTHLAPATDFSISLQGLRLVFASTGCDAISRWRQTEPVRLPLLVRSLRSLWTDPDSEGLHDHQIDQIAAALDGAGGAALFLHAPLLHAANGNGIDASLGRLELDDQGKLASRVAFERRLCSAGVRRGVFFRNPGRLLRTMLAAPGPVVVFSGHIHHASAVELDRSTLAMRSHVLAAPAVPEETVSLFTAPALGQQGRIHCRERPPWRSGIRQDTPFSAPRNATEGVPYSGGPGYLLARFQAGALVGLEHRTLSEDGAK
jgi:hypothetical protein